MNIKILFSYMKKCKALHSEPTFEGLRNYKVTVYGINEL